MPQQQGLFAYDERYRTVYDAGARFWNEHAPHPRLIECAKQFPAGSACIEFGCGEGFEARALAALGLRVTAIDLAPAAVVKARAETPASLGVSYLVGDVTDFGELLPHDGAFTMGVDVHCLHMMSDPHDRRNYLAGVKRVLKPGGLFYLQDMLSLDDVVPANEAEAGEIEELRAFKDAHTDGDATPRTIRTPQGEREIQLPLCPGCRALALREYVEEVTAAGFAVRRAERGGSLDGGYDAIIIVST